MNRPTHARAIDQNKIFDASSFATEPHKLPKQSINGSDYRRGVIGPVGVILALCMTAVLLPYASSFALLILFPLCGVVLVVALIAKLGSQN